MGAAHFPSMPVLRGADGRLSADFVEHIREAIEKQDTDLLRHVSSSLHESDLAELLEMLDSDERQSLIHLSGDSFNFLALTEVDDAIRSGVFPCLGLDMMVKAVQDMETDDAVGILEGLDERERKRIVDHLPASESANLIRSLNYPKKAAGRRMQTEFIAVPPFWTVGQTLDSIRESKELPDDFYEIFIVDPYFRPIGTVPLDRLLRTPYSERMGSIGSSNIYRIDATLDQEEVAYTFKRYDLVSAAVTDESGRLVGVITVDDIMDVIDEEADEDIRLLGGVRDEGIADFFLSTVRSRFTWLFVNLLTAILASYVISFFELTLERMVAVSILMPIVASMGGNAGTQTMTVTVRGLATGSLARFSIWRMIFREASAGFVNGCAFAIIMGVVAAFWFSNIYLGGVIGIAMVINLIVAGMFGVITPIALYRLGFDPAIASGSLVTMVTDVIGFISFLGLATLWLL